jgi:hypothetical protein
VAAPGGGDVSVLSPFAIVARLLPAARSRLIRSIAYWVMVGGRPSRTPCERLTASASLGSGGYGGLMPSPIGLAVKLALSPAGRRLIRHTIRAARSEEGRKLLTDTRKVATGPTTRKLLNQARQILKQPVEAATAPQSRERTAALRHRLGKWKPYG